MSHSIFIGEFMPSEKDEELLLQSVHFFHMFLDLPFIFPRLLFLSAW